MGAVFRVALVGKARKNSEYTSRTHDRVFLAQLEGVREMSKLVVVVLLVAVVREVCDLEPLIFPAFHDVGVEVGGVCGQDESWESIVPAKVHRADICAS